jgi:aryl-phospho-beta-D-glucosidase BglC (GH1 family)
MGQRLLFWAILAVLIFPVVLAHSQKASPVWNRAKYLQHGINLSSWFADSNNYSIPQLRNFTTPADIQHIRAMGFDHVRILVAPAIFECDGKWTSCERVQVLDQAVEKALSAGLAVILDFDPDAQYTHRLETDEQATTEFLRLWGKIADHYATMDRERVFFEVMNEFSISDAARWSVLLQRAVQTIRRHAPDSTILVTGAGFSDIWDLILLPNIADSNLIYNFHYYEPHIFTHQGANWAVEWWKDVHGLPFPATPLKLEEAIGREKDQAIRWKLLQYGEEHWNAARIATDINFAAKWAHERHVPLMCDEFGVYRNFTAAEDRQRWLSATRTALEANRIGWTMWDYQGSFGAVYKEGGTLRDDDTVLRALGLKR